MHLLLVASCSLVRPEAPRSSRFSSLRGSSRWPGIASERSDRLASSEPKREICHDVKNIPVVPVLRRAAIPRLRFDHLDQSDTSTNPSTAWLFPPPLSQQPKLSQQWPRGPLRLFRSFTSDRATDGSLVAVGELSGGPSDAPSRLGYYCSNKGIATSNKGITMHYY